MIGKVSKAEREVTVVGAGIAGLLAAYELDRRGFEVTLIEARTRAGGLISTRRTSCGIAESAAHSLLVTETARGLFAELGVDLVAVRKESKARFIYRAGKLRTFPLGPTEAFAAILRATRSGQVEEGASEPGRATLEQWGRKHLGPAAVDYLLAPFVLGIYGARPSELDLEATFPFLAMKPGQTLLQKVREYRADAKAKGSVRPEMMAPRYGMGALTEALEHRLEDRLKARFKRDHKIETLPEAPNVVLAVPAQAASDLIGLHDASLAEALKLVVYSPMVSVTVFVNRGDLKRPVRGVGVLVPESEGRDSLGVLFNSSAFEERVPDERALASFTMMLGGSLKPDLVRESDEEIRAIVRREMHALFGLEAEPAYTVVHKWHFAIPQYSSKLVRAWEHARSGFCEKPGRVLFGNWTGSVSLRGMIEAARSPDWVT